MSDICEHGVNFYKQRCYICRPEKAKEASSLAAPAGSEATWRRLAIQIAEQAEVVLQNAHWEVSYGSGDLLNTIKAVRRMQYTGSEMPPNNSSAQTR